MQVCSFSPPSLNLLPMARADSTPDLFVDAQDSIEKQGEEEIKEEEEIEIKEEETLEFPSSSSSTTELIKILDTPPSKPPLRRRRHSQSANGSISRETRSKILQKLHETPQSSSNSTLTSDPTANSIDEILEIPNNHPQSSSSTLTSTQTSDSRDEALESANGSLPFSMANFVIKSIFFQLNLLITCFMIPVKMVNFLFLMVYDPFGTVRHVKIVMMESCLWVWNGFILERIRNQQGLGKLVLRLGLGCFWSFFVGFLLVGILVSAFLGGSLVMRLIVEEPMQMVRELNFDYTKASPDAFVALDPRVGVDCSLVVLDGENKVGKELSLRVVPTNHRLQLFVSLMLPESDYNRKLGMFQVRTEFISARGKVVYSSRQPCMLRFKSPHIRFVETFLKSGSLLAGYSSESQTIKIKMIGFVEGNDPTLCVRVILEQRAEYRHGAGIPEIYAASLTLESQLPLLKRIVWNWRRTVFIWVGMALFFLELLIVLICCSPFIISRTRLRVRSEAADHS